MSGAASTCLPISLHLPPQAFDLLLEAHRLGLGDIIVLPVRTVERRQIARDGGLDLFNALGDLGHREVLVTGVDGFAGEQIELATQHDELGAGRADRRSIVAAELGDRLEVRHQPSGQPYQLDVALVSRSSRRLDWMRLSSRRDRSSAASRDDRQAARSLPA